MALPGLYETSTGWVHVSRYDPNPQPRGMRRLLRSPSPEVQARSVHRADIRRDDVVIHADDAVASAKKILSSQTHRNGELGLPSQVTYLVMSQLHGVLEEMRDVSRSLEKVEETRADVEAAGMPAESLRSLDEAAQRLLADKVIEPGRKLAELAALTLSRDTMRMLGQLSADDGLGAGAPTSFEDLEARIHAASELTPL